MTGFFWLMVVDPLSPAFGSSASGGGASSRLHAHLGDGNQRFHTVPDGLVERSERHAGSGADAVVAQFGPRPDGAELALPGLDAIGEWIDRRRGLVVQLRQQAADTGADVLDVAHVRGP